MKKYNNLLILPVLLMLTPVLYYLPDSIRVYVPQFLKNDLILNILSETFGIGAGALFTYFIVEKIYNNEKHKNWSKVERLVLNEINIMILSFILDLYNKFVIHKGEVKTFFNNFPDKTDSNNIKIYLFEFKKFIESNKLEKKHEKFPNLDEFIQKQIDESFSSIDKNIIPFLFNYAEYTELLEKIIEIKIAIKDIQVAIKKKTFNEQYIGLLIDKFIDIYNIKNPDVAKFG